mgnify:CR=1 FL=1
MHVPVMEGEVLELLAARRGGAFIDATVGNGGHARAILECAGPNGRLLGVDQDPEALAKAGAALGAFGSRCALRRGNFEALDRIAREAGFFAVNGILMDLGMCSDQVEAAERGFSFLRDGPLDMRMDPEGPVTAADLVNTWSEEQLALLLFRCGEEPGARRIARAIVRERGRGPIERTGALASLAARALGRRCGRAHPATRTFQALRIEVNRELEVLESGIEAAIGLLAPGGRLAVIAYHSLEDRIVKSVFREHAGRMESLAGGGRRRVGRDPAIRRITPKPVTPGKDEVQLNPRARSAKLRCVERME